MSPGLGRIARALGAGGAGALVVAVTIWLHLLAGGLGGKPLPAVYPLAPSIAVTPANLLALTLAPALILVLPLAIMAALSGPWPLRLLSALLLVMGWYWVADGVANEFASGFGNTWLPGEPFAELFQRPVLTPALLVLAVAAYMVVLSVINRATGRPVD